MIKEQIQTAKAFGEKNSCVLVQVERLVRQNERLKFVLKYETKALNYAIKILETEFKSYSRVTDNALSEIKKIRR